MILKGEIEAQLFSLIKALFKVIKWAIYHLMQCILYPIKLSHYFRNLHLVIISYECNSNGTHLFLALHGMQRVSDSNPLGSIEF